VLGAIRRQAVPHSGHSPLATNHSLLSSRLSPQASRLTSGITHSTENTPAIPIGPLMRMPITKNVTDSISHQRSVAVRGEPP